MLTIDEIFNRILLRSGSFVMKTKNLELDVDNFKVLVEDALALYSEQVPFSKEYTVDIRGRRQFTFMDDFDEELGRSPDWLSEVHPIRSAGTVYGYYPNSGQYHSPNYFGGKYQSEHLSDPIQVPWDYNKTSKVLTVPYDGFYKIRGVYKHIIETEVDSETGSETFVVKTLDISAQPFIKLCQAMFMIGVGRSRRAFTLQDLPILMDASEIISDGRELYKEVLDEDLPKYQKIHLAYGG